LQLLEKALRRGNDTFTAGDYREASRLLKAEEHPFAGPLWTLGSYVDDVASYRQSWGQWYASRARTADEAEAAQLIADGHVRHPMARRGPALTVPGTPWLAACRHRREQRGMQRAGALPG
jgi:hypothetical protein